MGEEVNIAGFTYAPRAKTAAGAVDQCEFHTSVDGKTWTVACKEQLDPPLAQPTQQTVSCSPIKARYFKFVVTHVREGDYAAVGEVGVVAAAGEKK